MNFKKKLAILLSVCMVLTSIPMTTWADVTEPSEPQQETVINESRGVLNLNRKR